MAKRACCAPMPKLNEFSFWKGVLAEFVAMTFFVYVGVGTAVSSFTVDESPVAPLTTAMAFGFSITALVYATAHTSGGHINPAVTLGLTIMGVCHPVQAIFYMIVQFLGAMLGATFVRFQTPGGQAEYDEHTVYTFGTNSLHQKGAWTCVEWHNSNVQERCAKYEYKAAKCVTTVTPASPYAPSHSTCPTDVTWINGAVFECVATALLMFVVCETAVNKLSIATPSTEGTMTAGTAPSGANIAPIAIGFAVFLAHCVGIPLTGCGINPARSFGAWFVSEKCLAGGVAWEEENGRNCHEKDLSIFLIFPFIGAAIAAILCRAMFDSNQDNWCGKPVAKSAAPPTEIEMSNTPTNKNDGESA
jgi:glycerol uptake facilitator-like aquaporin